MPPRGTSRFPGRFFDLIPGFLDRLHGLDEPEPLDLKRRRGGFRQEPVAQLGREGPDDSPLVAFEESVDFRRELRACARENF
jgi:hypothetical protein